jgi:peptide/nickel transport system substrate-binding protein
VVPIADSFFSPRSPDWAAIEPSIVRHPYDQRRSVALIEALGYRRGPDGAFANAAGRKLTVGMQVTRAQEIQVKTAFAVEDYWRQVGVTTDVDVVAVQLAQDVQYRANFPGFAVQRQPGDVEALPKLHSSEARLASRGYRGQNNARYMDPEMDALVERFQVTVPLPERTQTIAQIVRKVSDEVIWMTTFFDSEPALISNRLVNVGAKDNGAAQTWNAYEWSTR